MNIYKITFKEKQGESYWDNKPLLVVAADYGNAQDKAVNYCKRQTAELVNIELFGETTDKQDVFWLRGR